MTNNTITVEKWKQMTWDAIEQSHIIEMRNPTGATRMMDVFDVVHRKLANHMQTLDKYTLLYQETGKIHIVKRSMYKRIIKHATEQIIVYESLVYKCIEEMRTVAQEIKDGTS